MKSSSKAIFNHVCHSHNKSIQVSRNAVRFTHSSEGLRQVPVRRCGDSVAEGQAELLGCCWKLLPSLSLQSHRSHRPKSLTSRSALKRNTRWCFFKYWTWPNGRQVTNRCLWFLRPNICLVTNCWLWFFEDQDSTPHPLDEGIVTDVLWSDFFAKLVKSKTPKARGASEVWQRKRSKKTVVLAEILAVISFPTPLKGPLVLVVLFFNYDWWLYT